MKLLLMRHLWGIEEPLSDVLPRIKSLGYDGIEGGLPAEADADSFRSMLSDHGLRFNAMIFTGGSSVEDHIDSFKEQLERAMEFSPVLVNVHDGRDHFSMDDAVHYFDATLRFEQSLQSRVAHESHRGRILYNPWVTVQLLDRFPEMQICADYSHWVCVAERLLDDQKHVMSRCAAQVLHVHARVGYEEGPQVSDPRAPEYQRHLLAHEAWWDEIWDSQISRGFEESTLTPEFGPPGYLHTLPYTNVPVSNLWGICNWQADRQRKRFEERYAG